MSEFEHETADGLPEELPKGETILWQGTPDWWNMAKRVFHVRKVVIYSLLILLIQALTLKSNGQFMHEIFMSASGWIAMAAVALSILLALAFFTARSTRYTVTNKRLVIRSGIAITINLNLPFTEIESAALKVYPDGSGDIPFVITDKQRISYVLLWPNIRPWKYSQPQPMLRCVDSVKQVAEIVTQALANENTDSINIVKAGVSDKKRQSKFNQPQTTALA